MLHLLYSVLHHESAKYPDSLDSPLSLYGADVMTLPSCRPISLRQPPKQDVPERCIPKIRTGYTCENSSCCSASSTIGDIQPASIREGFNFHLLRVTHWS